MVDYVFTDGTASHTFSVCTDAADVNANNFTVMDHNGFVFDNLPAAIQALFGRNLARLQTTKKDLIAAAVAASMNLTAIEVGDAVPVTLVLQGTALVAPTLAAVTGSGAAGTLSLSWGAITNANNYVIDRATNVGFTTGVTLGIYNGGLLAFVDSGLTPATPYFYRITARGVAGFTASPFGTATATSHA